MCYAGRASVAHRGLSIKLPSILFEAYPHLLQLGAQHLTTNNIIWIGRVYPRLLHLRASALNYPQCYLNRPSLPKPTAIGVSTLNYQQYYLNRLNLAKLTAVEDFHTKLHSILFEYAEPTQAHCSWGLRTNLPLILFKCLPKPTAFEALRTNQPTASIFWIGRTYLSLPQL